MPVKWIIDPDTEKEAKESIQKKEAALEKWSGYVRDVSANPFHSPVRKRIAKLSDTSYPDGTYRYRKDPLRVVYFPERSTQTVYTLEAATSDDASYKIRSKK